MSIPSIYLIVKYLSLLSTYFLLSAGLFANIDNGLLSAYFIKEAAKKSLSLFLSL